METKQRNQSILYQTPLLEQHQNYVSTTGLSATFDFAHFEEPLLENNDFLGGTE